MSGWKCREGGQCVPGREEADGQWQVKRCTKCGQTVWWRKR